MATQTAPAITASVLAGHTVNLPGGRQQPSLTITADVKFDGVITREPAHVEYRARITDETGTPVVELPFAAIGPIEEVLNGIGSTSVTLPVDHPSALYLTDSYFRELQVYRGDSLVFFGPMVRVNANDQEITASALDPLWHLARRYVGGELDNQLSNGTFADGFEGWKKIAGDFAAFGFTETTPTATEFVVSNSRRQGSFKRSAQLTNDSRDPDHFIQIYQDATVSGGSFGVDVTMVAWCYMSSGYGTGYEPEQTRGIFLQRLPQVVHAPLGYYTDSLEVAEDRITVDTPRDQWVRMEATVTVPAGETNLIHATLGCPDGMRVFWSNARLSRDVGESFPDTDQARIIDGLVDHAQDSTYNKSDANITVNSSTAPNTGVTRSRIYRHADRANIWSAILQYTQLADGVDVSMDVTPTARNFRVHYPQRGSLRKNAAFTLDESGGNCTLISWSHDGEDAASRVIVRGAGFQSQDEGHAEDTTRFGGLTLERIESAEMETTVDALPKAAAEALTVYKNPERLELECLPGSKPHLAVHPGDTVNVRIQIGGDGTTSTINIEGVYRVTERTLIPESDVCRFVLNRRVT